MILSEISIGVQRRMESLWKNLEDTVIMPALEDSLGRREFLTSDMDKPCYYVWPPQINTRGHSDISSVLEDDGCSSQYVAKVRQCLWLCSVAETESRDLNGSPVFMAFFQSSLPRTGRDLSKQKRQRFWSLYISQTNLYSTSIWAFGVQYF